MERENRSAALVDAEVDGLNFRGYAAVFNTPWNDDLIREMGYTETVAPGTFRKALAGSPNVPLLWQHEKRDLLATTGGKTLRLREDGNGLLVEASLPDTPLGQHISELVRRGDVRGMSYGVQTTPADSRMEIRNGDYYRVLRNAQKLLDVTLTFEPAYEATTAELRSMMFAALPLQTLIGGPETGQTDPGVATEDERSVSPPATPGPDSKRAREFYLEQLEWKVVG